NNLLTIHTFPETGSFDEVRKQIRDLTGLKDVQIGITPFTKINRHFVFTELHDTVSILFQDPETHKEKNDLYQQLESYFCSQENEVLALPNIEEGVVNKYPFLEHLHKKGARSL